AVIVGEASRFALVSRRSKAGRFAYNLRVSPIRLHADTPTPPNCGCGSAALWNLWFASHLRFLAKAPIDATTTLKSLMNPISLSTVVDEAPIVAIVRRPKVDPVCCIEHLFKHGIRLVEITMDTSGAVEVLESLRSRVPAS